MRSRFRMAWFAVVLVAALTTGAYAQDEPATDSTAGGTSSPKSAKNTSSASEPTLRRDMLVPLATVKEFFPEVSRESFEVDSAALDTPTGTRIANYASKDGSKKVILSVDQYRNPGEAQSAYQEANQKSQTAESNPIAISNIGQQVFAYTMSQGTDTRAIIISLDGILIVRATLSGYDATTDNIAKLADLTRKEVDQAHAHVSARRRR